VSLRDTHPVTDPLEKETGGSEGGTCDVLADKVVDDASENKVLLSASFPVTPHA
jgi:hypothetical protein